MSATLELSPRRSGTMPVRIGGEKADACYVPGCAEAADQRIINIDEFDWR